MNNYDEYLEFELINGTYIISKFKDNKSEVVIPSEYKGKKVTEIADNAFDFCVNLTSVEIPNSITKIGDNAFSDCTSLTSIIIPNSITSISSGVFIACTSLSSIVIPDSVKSIGDYAFEDCESLKSVTIPKSITNIGKKAFFGCDSLLNVIVPNCGTKIANDAFSSNTIVNKSNHSFGEVKYTWSDDNTKVTATRICKRDASHIEVETVSTISTITQEATCLNDEITKYVAQFNNSSFKTQTKENIKTKDKLNHSFGEVKYTWNDDNTKVTATRICKYDETHIEEETVDVKVELIKQPNLTEKGLNKYTSNVFTNKAFSIQVKEVEIELTNYYNYFEFKLNNDNTYTINKIKDNISSIIIPSEYNGKKVTSIGYLAFYNCTSLENITIPESVTSISKYAFNNCSNLKSISIPESVKSIGDFAFNNCSNLISITIPQGVKSIAKNTFSNCTSLASITIPKSVTNIGVESFSNCESLKSISIPESVTSIGMFAFSGCSSLTIYCEAKSKPSTWNDDWNSSTRPVVWNYKKR